MTVDRSLTFFTFISVWGEEYGILIHMSKRLKRNRSQFNELDKFNFKEKCKCAILGRGRSILLLSLMVFVMKIAFENFSERIGNYCTTYLFCIVFLVTGKVGMC